MNISMIQILFHQISRGHYFRQLQFANAETKWTSIGLLIFAVVFLIVGLYRNVEIKESQLKPRVKIFCYVLHFVGVIDFSFAILLLAIDIHRSYQDAILPFFITAVLLLFPLHIYLALHKRINNNSNLS